MVLRTEPDLSGRTTWKVWRFIVLQALKTHCVCLPIYTYQGEGTSEPVEHYAPIIPPGTVQHKQGPGTRNPIEIHGFEEEFCRINLSRTTCVDHDVRARKIGNCTAEGLNLIRKYITEIMGLTK